MSENGIKLCRKMTLFDPTDMMSMVDLVAISMEKPKTDSVCSLEKEFTEFNYMIS